MSIAILHDRIVSVYAFGTWMSVKKGSFCVDAYELLEEIDWKYEHQLQILNEYESHPKAHTGACWLDELGQRISMPLYRIEAFKEDMHD